MNGPVDWSRIGFVGSNVPESCCKEISSQSNSCDANSIQVNGDGCMMKLQSAIENNAMILGGVGIGIALIQVSFKSNYFFVNYIRRIIII